MKVNEFTCIKGRGIILVPYERRHVPKYNGWMQSEELQQQTGSEPLTLEDEYRMQASWREDEDKCTFIILDADVHEKSGGDEVASMIGDVNVFLLQEEDQKTGEVTLMIAEQAARRKGFGKEALCTIIRYGMECPALSLKSFSAKIGYENIPSLALFKKTGFEEVSRSDVFQEVTLKLTWSEDVQQKIVRETPMYSTCDYCPS